MKGKLSVSLLISLFVLQSTVCTAIDLPLPLKTQLHSNWCWAAASQAILAYNGMSPRQCDIVDKTYAMWGNMVALPNPSSCQTNDNNFFYIDEWYNQGANPEQIQAALATWGLSSTQTGTYLQPNECAAELTESRPFLIAIYWGTQSHPTGGHAVVGYGYDGEVVKYMDPWPPSDGGGMLFMPYDKLVNNPGISYWGNSLKYVHKEGFGSWGAFYANNIDAVSGTVTLTGIVNTTSSNTWVYFDVGLTPSYGKTYELPYVINASTSNYNIPVRVKVTLKGFSPNTYHYRVRGSNSIASYTSQDQVFTMPSAAISYPLTVNKVGNGTVTSISPSSPAISCGTTCSTSYIQNTSVTLTANPSPDNIFTGWSGCDSTNGSSCTIRMSTSRSVVAEFAVATKTLTVSKSGTGTGTVTSASPASPIINCGSTCSNSYIQNTQVTLTATPDPGKIFTGWSGACSGRDACTVIMNTDQSVSANFLPDITPILMMLLAD